MQVVSIDDEVKMHYNSSHVKGPLFDKFEPIIEERLIEKYSTAGYLVDIDPIEAACVFHDMRNAYLNSAKESCEHTKTLFKKHGILFRLYDVHFSIHSLNRICMVWIINGNDYAFEFTFEDQNGPNALPFLCRTLQINREGTVERGDATPYNAKELVGLELPEWFVAALDQKQ